MQCIVLWVGLATNGRQSDTLYHQTSRFPHCPRYGLVKTYLSLQLFVLLSTGHGSKRAQQSSEPDPGNELRRPSGCQVVDVEFHSPIPEVIGCITFHNHYTHTLTLQYQTQQSRQTPNSESDPAEWRTAIRRFQLMPNCHYERGSQSLVVLNKAHFTSQLENTRRLRLILRQPSPDWVQFGIRDLKIYSVSNPFHQNRNIGTKPEFMSSEGMEQVLRNGLWTENDTESGPDINSHPYNITILSYT